MVSWASAPGESLFWDLGIGVESQHFRLASVRVRLGGLTGVPRRRRIMKLSLGRKGRGSFCLWGERPPPVWSCGLG